MWVDGKGHAPASLLEKEILGAHCIGGLVRPRVIWRGVENLASHWDSIPGPSIPERVAIPTEIPAHESIEIYRN